MSAYQYKKSYRTSLIYSWHCSMFMHLHTTYTNIGVRSSMCMWHWHFFSACYFKWTRKWTIYVRVCVVSLCIACRLVAVNSFVQPSSSKLIWNRKCKDVKWTHFNNVHLGRWRLLFTWWWRLHQRLDWWFVPWQWTTRCPSWLWNILQLWSLDVSTHTYTHAHKIATKTPIANSSYRFYFTNF